MMNSARAKTSLQGIQRDLYCYFWRSITVANRIYYRANKQCMDWVRFEPVTYGRARTRVSLANQFRGNYML